MNDQYNKSIELNKAEINRYKRHLSLAEIGLKGQKSLKNSSVLCIGSGGLGSPLLTYLASAGVGCLGIVDFDKVEESNLQRQILHSNQSIGKYKTDSAYNRISELNPYCQVKTFNYKLTHNNAIEIFKNFDIICDCTDNFPTKYLINDACYILKKPWVYGSIAKFEGQASVFNLTSNSPNYRDLIPIPPPLSLLPTCVEGGVMGILPGVIGLIQATEVIKIIAEIGTTLDGRLLVFDALQMKFKELNLPANKENKNINKLINYEEFCSNKGIEVEDASSKIKNISAKKLNELIEINCENILILDVREPFEFEMNSIKNSFLFPLKNIEKTNEINKIKEMIKGKQVFVVCESGKRSLKALRKFKEYGIEGTNIDGGIKAWLEEIKEKK